ncbi:hypothetical protein M9H77_00112 [Catharanthus roseus]|nr:hypothetical protein M9H77_00112 [Catharanthus roseus]
MFSTLIDFYLHFHHFLKFEFFCIIVSVQKYKPLELRMSRLAAHLTSTPLDCNTHIIKKTYLPGKRFSQFRIHGSCMKTQCQLMSAPSLTLGHALDLKNITRSRICNHLTKEQKKKEKEYMESFGWKEIRNKDARKVAKAFCIENGIGKNQWKYWLEHPRRYV